MRGARPSRRDAISGFGCTAMQKKEDGSVNPVRLILASSSPRRIEMLRASGLDPIVIPPNVSEALPEGIAPKDAVLFLALKKALAAEKIAAGMGYAQGEVIVAADTVVYHEGIIGKPADEAEAFAILKQLCGKSHEVMTGVAILQAGSFEREVFCETTRVFFKAYADEEILAYVQTPEPYDKAGGYAIQGAWGKYVERIEGDYSNVMGFPWKRIQERLRRAPSSTARY